MHLTEPSSKPCRTYKQQVGPVACEAHVVQHCNPPRPQQMLVGDKQDVVPSMIAGSSITVALG
jgi:hypothetical protein